MKVIKRIMAAVAFLLAIAVLLLSTACGVGVWMVKKPVTDRTVRIMGRIEAALDLGDQGLEQVKTSLANAAVRLDSVREEQRKLAQEPRNSGTVRRVMARTVQQRIAPEIGNAHETIHTVAEAAVLINSVMEDLSHLPFPSNSGLDSSRLTEINGRLSEMESSAWELTRLLGETGSDDDADAQLTRMEQTLKTMQNLVAEYEPQFRQVRERTDELKAQILRWITPAAVLISLVFFWIALSQISVLVHAWSWFRH
jgi:hypothetical protein